MARNKRQQRLASQAPSQHHEWKSNPVIVAGGSAAATILLCIAIVTQIVIPTQTAKLEIEALKAKDASRGLQAELDAAQKSNNTLERKKSSLSTEVASLKRQLLEARVGSIFNAGNPYPTGLGLVRIGAPIDEVRKHFLSNQIETDPDRPEVLKVNLQNSPFIWATYSFDKQDPRQRIAHASFTLDYRQNFGDYLLPNKITEAIGPPVENPRRGYYRWTETAGVSIYLLDSSYMIMAPSFSPAVWPD